MNTTNDKPEALRLADKYARHYTACEMAIVFCNSDADTAHKKKLTDEAREALSAEIQRLTAELEEARKDADRYQWLREQAPDNMDVEAVFRMPTCERFDAAIDAAMDVCHG